MIITKLTIIPVAFVFATFGVAGGPDGGLSGIVPIRGGGVDM